MSYCNKVVEAFEKHADPDNAAKMKAYMRGQFEFYGVKSPERKEIQKVLFQRDLLPPGSEIDGVICELWVREEREVQLFAMELLFKYKKEFDPSYFDLIEKMIVTRSWWDTVDYIASTLVGHMYKIYPEEGAKFISKWRKSENMWLNRTCLLFQLKYKNEVDEELLYSLIDQFIDHKDFFIRKAIGWSLRQYAKFDPESVLDFVNSRELSPLSRKEALKHF